MRNKAIPILISLCVFNIIGLAQTDVSIPAPTQEDHRFYETLVQSKNLKEAIQILEENKTRDLKSIWKDLVDLGSAYERQNENDKSLFIYQIVNEVASHINGGRRVPFALQNIGRIYYLNGEYLKSINILHQGLDRMKTVPEDATNRSTRLYILNTLSDAYFGVGDFVEAQKSATEAIAYAEKLGDQEGLALALLALANAQEATGEYVKSINILEKSFVILSGLHTGENTAHALEHLIWSCRQAGEYTKGFLYAHRLLSLGREAGNTDAVIGALIGLSVLYADQGDFEKMFEYLNESLSQARKIDDKISVSVALLNLGLYYDHISASEKSVNVLEEAWNLASAANSKMVLMDVGYALTSVYLKLGKNVEGLEKLNKCLGLAEEAGDRTRLARLIYSHAVYFFRQHEYDRAITECQRALILTDQINLPDTKYLVLTLKAQAHSELHQYLLGEQAAYDAISLVEGQRIHVVGKEREKQLYFENKTEPYYTMIDLLNKKGHLTRAFAYAEGVKARALLDSLSMRRSHIEEDNLQQIEKKMNLQEKEREKELLARLVKVNNQIRDSLTISQISDNRGKGIENAEDLLRKARFDYEAFRSEMAATHQDTQAPHLEVTVPDEQQINRDLGQILSGGDTGLIEFVVLPEKTLIFTVTTNKREGSQSIDQKILPISVNLKTVNVKSGELGKLVDEYRSKLALIDPDFIGDSQKLYAMLLMPIIEQLRECRTIRIIPDGCLWDLPFQALQDKQGKYLLEKYAVSYAQSIRVLKAVQSSFGNEDSSEVGIVKDKNHSDEKVLLAIGDPYDSEVPSVARGQMISASTSLIDQNNSSNLVRIKHDTLPQERINKRGEFLSRLPEASFEVDKISSFYTPSGAVKVLKGPDAREDIFKSEASRYRVIHIAGHGLLDNTHPLYSSLVLARPPAGARLSSDNSSADGMLEAWEIMELKLHADLVILSACETSRGRFSNGEGLVGMSWAFFIAGVPATVVSQWKVDSTATAKLMINFHQNLTQAKSRDTKNSISEALRQAGLSLLKSPGGEYAHPFYWAAFVHIGKGN